jgi:hypothetical protein
MSQVNRPNGLYLGSGLYIFAPNEGGDPNAYAGDGDPAQKSSKGIDTVSLGSVWLDKATPALWIKTGVISPATPAGVWTQIS